VTFIAALIIMHAAPPLPRAEFSGWRGNGTGLYPDANPPAEWHRIPRGALDGLRCQAPPKAGKAPLVKKGLLRDWLILGPFPVKDSVRGFNEAPIKEGDADPAAGEKAAGKEWKPHTAPDDDIYVFGTAQLPWLDLGQALGYRPNQAAYAFTRLYSPRGGKARIVADHGHGMAAWVNGKEVYRHPERRMGLGAYPALSKIELGHIDPESPSFDIDLKAGWNRLLLKLGAQDRPGWTDMRVCLRVMDPADVKYETKNVRWMAPLPGRSTSTPIIVGDRVFVFCEPDELVCLDKMTGRKRWSAFINYYEALAPEAKRKRPAFARKIGPLVAKLKAEADSRKRTRLRAEMQKELLAIDEETFRLPSSGHFESHFGIVGFTMPTPVSDGKSVFVWSGMGVAACFSLDGERRWITRIEAVELNYGSSPALADGILAVFQNRLYGLDAATGELKWEQPKVTHNIAGIVAGRLNGEAVFVMQRGDVVRPADGKLLFWQRDSGMSNDSGWSPPVMIGPRVYSPKHGVMNLREFTFSGKWKPAARVFQLPDVISRREGKWIDRSTPASPLIHAGHAYQIDIYHSLYVTDLKTGRMVVREELDMEGLMHYNAVPVAASPTLVGSNVIVQDNQGTGIVLKPGPKFEVVSRNRLATQLPRRLPIPAQETIGYAPPIADGDRLYIRGEAYLYCIAKD
jgi:outer membrane protein assembly factor BamB